MLPMLLSFETSESTGGTLQRTCSRSCWVRSPWMLVAGKPWPARKSSSASALFLVSTNTSVRPCMCLDVKIKRD